MSQIYLIGSLRNPEIPKLGRRLREDGFNVFDDWFSAGPIGDDSWRDYHHTRGDTYSVALGGAAAKNIFNFDKRNIDDSDSGLLVLPAGKSGHLELGYMIGRGKKGYVYFPEGEPERWDVMYQFADGVAFRYDELIVLLDKK